MDNQSFTLLAACNSLDGFLPDVCLLVDHTVDSAFFAFWFRLYVYPRLGNYGRGEENSIVVFDNVMQRIPPAIHMPPSSPLSAHCVLPVLTPSHYFMVPLPF